MVPDQRVLPLPLTSFRDSLLTLTFDSCPPDGPDELAEVCAAFGITSQDACFVLEGAVEGSVCLLGSTSDGDLEAVPWIGGLARFTDDD
jgi:hypothetical protein